MTKIKYGVKMMESERGSGCNYWTAKFDSVKKAHTYINKVKKDNEDNFKATHTVPDYYCQTVSDEIIIIME